MKAKFFVGLTVFVMMAFLAAAQSTMAQQGPSPEAEKRIQNEVRHQLVMLPFLDVFDSLTYKVDGYNVTLGGQVTRASLKSDAGAVVKKVEGVEKIDNQIEVLPPSPMDDRIRIRLFRSIYGYAPLQRYALPVIKPIRIIVKNGHVTLEGVVDSESDKNMVTLRAKSVPGTFSVTNNLAVEK
ncbi:MAG: BON domain-containing protein [Candidatus Acidiferrales bacterium]